ncbi:DUF4190 domain-containing protein [Streptomyces sp. NPDC102395]|uniref:DUF4190 domain-containing protein n=1 Tax=Streptomyces sp. NPDC102395 TaxID=3366168 RepID=UPI0038043453
MSDDAPTPAVQGEAAASRPDAADDAVQNPWAAPGSVPEGAEGPQYAIGEEPSDADTGPQDAVPTPKVPLTKPDAEAPPVADAKPVTEGGTSASPSVASGPWPEPAVGSGNGTDTTVVFPEEPVSFPEAPAPQDAPSPETFPQAEERQAEQQQAEQQQAEEPPAEEPQPFAPRDQVAPAVHHQPTVTSLPGAGADPAQGGPQPWAGPFGPPAQGPAQAPVPTHAPTSTPPAGAPFAAFPPPDPATLAGGPPPGFDPYAPPPGGPVPPPPIAPGGPGAMPYGYPGGYGHQGAPGYGGGLPAYYGWNGMRPPSNGMGIAAMVLGIVSAVGFCMWPATMIIGPLAFVFGLIGRSKAKRGEANNPGQALAGIICGIAGFLLAAAMLVLFIVTRGYR